MVLQTEQEDMKGSLTKLMLSVTTVRSMVTMQMSVLQTIRTSKKVMRRLQNMMVTTKDEERHRDKWNLDLICSSHMTSRKDWFFKTSPSKKNKVKFANDYTLAVEGICDVLIMRKDDKQSVISNVL